MRQRVLERAAHEPLSAGDLARIDRCLTAALAVRDAALPDDHHVDALHPARTVLILLDDARMTDPGLLAAATLVDSNGSAFAAPSDAADARALALAAAIPTPQSVEADELLEALLGLHSDLLDVALAERLDHARHLHLRDSAGHAAALALEERIYLPLAERRGGLVGRRYDRWHTAFRRRIQAAR
ncbi:MAG TPA: hypothetical protein VF035_08485 [Longimicrobiales bacterium]